jgi:hypothetical protein
MKLNSGYTGIEYPPGVEKTVMQVLSDCPGRDNAISRAKLLAIVQSAHPKTSDRQLRACVNKLRKDGQMICSTGGEEGGYWTAASWDELSEYLDREVVSRLTDLAEQRSALTKAGESRWGYLTKQERMF